MSALIATAVAAGVTFAYHALANHGGSLTVTGDRSVLTRVPRGSSEDDFGPGLHSINAADCPVQSGDYFLPGATARTLGSLPAGPFASLAAGKRATSAWLAARHASDANISAGSFLLRATGTAQIVITGVQVILLARRPAPPGRHISFVGNCGAGPPTVALAVNLDKSVPRARMQLFNSQGGWSPVSRLSYVLDHAHPFLTINISGTTTRYDARWEVLVSYVNGGKSGSTVLGAGGQRPFHTTGTTRRPAKTYYWSSPQRGWATSPY